MSAIDPQERLAAIRKSIEAEEVSYGEIAELQGLVAHIDPSDVVLLEWAGVPEDDFDPHNPEPGDPGEADREDEETTCPDCNEPLQDPDGLSEPNHLHCDLCSKVEHAADLTSDWNGETGNHLSCEQQEVRA